MSVLAFYFISRMKKMISSLQHAAKAHHLYQFHANASQIAFEVICLILRFP